MRKNGVRVVFRETARVVELVPLVGKIVSRAWLLSGLLFVLFEDKTTLLLDPVTEACVSGQAHQLRGMCLAGVQGNILVFRDTSGTAAHVTCHDWVIGPAAKRAHA